MSRLEKLRAMLANDPKDVFLRYAVGMELKGMEQHKASLDFFNELMQENPPHVPSFFMAGQTLVAAGDINQARAVLRDGIENARRQGDAHAAAEMSEFLASLGSMGE